VAADENKVRTESAKGEGYRRSEVLDFFYGRLSSGGGSKAYSPRGQVEAIRTSRVQGKSQIYGLPTTQNMKSSCLRAPCAGKGRGIVQNRPRKD